MSPKSALRLAAALVLAAVAATSVSALPGPGGANNISAEAVAGAAGGTKGKRLQCLTCRNCRMFEVVIHSNDCDADSTHCMVGAHEMIWLGLSRVRFPRIEN